MAENAVYDGPISKKQKLEKCPHELKCYRRNPHHFREYSHPHLNKMIENNDRIPDGLPQNKHIYEEQIKILKPLLGNTIITPTASSSTSSQNKPLKREKTLKPNATTLEKLEMAAPYNLFFSKVPKSPATCVQPNTIAFSDLLCPSLGQLERSIQFNFIMDITWLLNEYKKHNVDKLPLTLVYGDDDPTMAEYINAYHSNIIGHCVKMKDPFGCHHSKFGIYRYADESIRVVISTANLYTEDWNHYNQGVWISPALPKLPETGIEIGESPTNFKKSLITYLDSYKQPFLRAWIDYVKTADCRAIRIFFVASIPGKHPPKHNGSHLHYVGELLSKHCALPKKSSPEAEGPLSWGIVAQASSIGNLGAKPADWLRGALLRSLAGHKDTNLVANSSATFSIVFPSMGNVLSGYWGAQSGGCIPYRKAAHEKQKWLHDYLHQWKADKLERSFAMPHIKSYCRISPCLTKLAYFLLTSANISKAAWGNGIGKDGTTYVRSYEVGVMFLPELFDQEYFEIDGVASVRKNDFLFPFIYDLPLTEYKKDDYPYCT